MHKYRLEGIGFILVLGAVAARYLLGEWDAALLSAGFVSTVAGNELRRLRSDLAAEMNKQG